MEDIVHKLVDQLKWSDRGPSPAAMKISSPGRMKTGHFYLEEALDFADDELSELFEPPSEGKLNVVRRLELEARASRILALPAPR